MSNMENLIPMSKRSKNEARELGKKGGDCFGKSKKGKENTKR